jgi:hypothetical protein
MLMAKFTGSNKSKQGGKAKSVLTSLRKKAQGGKVKLALTSLGNKVQGQCFPILHWDVIAYHVALD